ncbi:LOW QUALITY PROTEIN: hypothetical protein OSB04_011062 [Centaurea solstitialis]|uniref:Transposase-associated domain-containing protein n=1 Tax=Centaurea solstitialis TaxID=347529 RepID=A0AA38TTH0_9ASTR|nr:LOW QUALITY PROTEIN: hypothetical protein OSB04_011062 [Centaurea solstitialis]
MSPLFKSTKHLIMSIDKTWTTIENRNSDEFSRGLESFVERSKAHVDSRGLIRCHCRKCVNSDFIKVSSMKAHIEGFGFSRRYITWVYHGETINPPIVDDVAPRNEMAGAIDDVMGENDTNHDKLGYGGVVDDGFNELLDEVNAELYPGCTWFSSLDFLAKLMNIKVNNKWTDSSFDRLLELLQSAFQKENRLPSSYYEGKKKLRKIGLGYESIHVCKNDCFLFWKEHEALQSCPVCNESRWVDKNTKGKKVAHKVLQYFPLTPRLRRLYCSRHTAKNMIWHSIGRSQEGTMRHPVDGSSWKEFDRKYPNFSKEPQNVRLGLAADGFNPYGNMSSAHSTWPVVLTTYNLPHGYV